MGLKAWRGFQGLRTYQPVLQADLRNLDEFLRDIRTQVGLLIEEDSISTADTIAVTTDTQVIAGVDLDGGGTLDADVTINHADSGVAANSYAFPSTLTVNARGHITAITAGSAPAALASTTPATVDLTAAIGVGTTAARADHEHALDQSIVPTWTAIHTFSAQPVFNAGISLGSSGQIVGTTFSVYGVTAVARPAAYTQTYATASRTHASPTAVTVTDSTTGAANTTLVDVTTAALADPVKCNDNFADVAAQLNALVADVANVKQVLNQVIDDDQSQGLKQ